MLLVIKYYIKQNDSSKTRYFYCIFVQPIVSWILVVPLVVFGGLNLIVQNSIRIVYEKRHITEEKQAAST